jgi:metal-responsive CopG/Arc/MetJ family transcriptional regulator
LRQQPERGISGDIPHSIRVAVSLPKPIANAVDQLAEQRGESRSRFIASLLARVASAKRDREIRAEIDALFASPTVRAEQRDTAEAFLGVSPWRREKP